MSDIEFRFEIVRDRWDEDGNRVIEEVRLLGTSLGWDKLDECRECQAVLDQFGRCHYCDRSWVWGNSGADPCRDLSAGVGIEDPGHTS